jgi:heptosyltransferase-2
VTLASAVLDAAPDGARVLFATSAAYDGLYRDDPRVSVLVSVERGGFAAARARIREFRPTLALDLQGTWRSRRLLAGLRGTARVVVRKDSLRRRLAVLGLRRRAPARVYERFLEALERAAGAARPATPRLVVPEPRHEVAIRRLPPERVWIGMAPGSRWANKRWPIERFIAVARDFLGERDAGVAVVVGPGDATIASAFRHELAGHDGLAIVDVGSEALPAHLERLDVLLTGDSGPMHVAEAVGTPVVALFGPTTADFGFTPFLPASRVLERRLWCRPCHVHGGNRCPLGHHRCLRDTTEGEVLTALRRVLALRGAHRLASTHQGGTQ